MAIKKSFLSAFKKASRTTYFKDLRKFEGRTFEETSRFTGITVELNPLEATIYGFCLDWYTRYEQGMDTECPVSTYDNMRYYFLSLNPMAYMELLDDEEYDEDDDDEEYDQDEPE